MRLTNPSRIALFFLAIPLCYIGYQVFEERSVSWAYWILLPIVPMIALLIFAPQIDYWWHKKYPLPVDDRLLAWINKHDRFYQKLSKEDKHKYLYRMSLYLEARAFESIGGDDKHRIPDDLQCMIASQGIQIAFYRDDFLIGEFDRIFAYKHPFPSPKMQFLHTLETDAEDGLIILALDYATSGILNPNQFYNITLHAYAEALIKANPSYNWPVVPESAWDIITTCLGFTKDQIEQVIGYELLDLLPIAMVTYLLHSDRMKYADPVLYQQIEQAYLNK